MTDKQDTPEQQSPPVMFLDIAPAMLRDLFAAASIAGAGDPAYKNDTKAMAAYAYRLADAMMAERDKWAK